MIEKECLRRAARGENVEDAAMREKPVSFYGTRSWSLCICLVGLQRSGGVRSRFKSCELTLAGEGPLTRGGGARFFGLARGSSS